MAKIKICGLQRPCDIEYVNEAMPDYIGFVFTKSKRQVDEKQAMQLKSLLSERIKTVGVFVNERIETIKHLCADEIVDIIQLHGDEDEDYISTVKKIGLPVIKAIRIRKKGDSLKTSADFALFDTYSQNSYGGTGETFKWDLCKNCSEPFFLAGGLDINNVKTAVEAANPYCVDVSSAVETNGKKDKEKIINFINYVRSFKI